MDYLKSAVMPTMILIMLAVPINAWAYCSEPSFYNSVPSAPSSYQKPSVPYCLNAYSYSREHSCEQWEIDSYLNEINSYIRDLNDFAEEARGFANSAIRYANDAVSYADCEAEEAKTQHE